MKVKRPAPTKRYKIEKFGVVYIVYSRERLSECDIFILVLSWLFVILTAGIGYVIIEVMLVERGSSFAEALFPQKEWEREGSHRSLEEALVWVEEKKYQDEVYYL